MLVRTALTSALMIAFLTFPGCVGNEEGSASIYFQDAPEDDFAELHVVFTKAEVHAAGGAEDNESSDGNSSAGWVTINEDANGIDMDLLSAQGSEAILFGETELEAGRYTQIRATVKEVYGIDHDGARVNVTLASGTIKVVKSFEVEADMETRIVIDVDLDKSLRETPQGWRMTPVIGKTTTQIVEDASSGDDVADEGEVQTVA